MAYEAQRYYEFGCFRIDAFKRLLLREGEVVPLTPKAFDTLLALVESGGQVVQKDELMNRVWPDSYVEEGNLTYNISTLRKALGERPGENLYIVTVPGRGYCFVADVIKVPDERADLIVAERTRTSVIVEETVVEDFEQEQTEARGRADKSAPASAASAAIRFIKNFSASSVKARTLVGLLRRHRVLIAIVCVGLVYLGVLLLRRPSPHQPSGESIYWYTQGTSALREGQYYKASKALREAINADEKFALAHARLAEALTEMDYTDEAKNEIIRAELLVPDRSTLPLLDGLYLEAITKTVLRDLAPAIESYQKIAQQVPDSEKPHAYLELGSAYEKNDQLDKAKENYTQATKLNPQEAAAFLRLGVVCAQQQDFASASAAFDRAENLYQALTNLEGVAEVLYQRGLLFNSLGRSAQARAPLQKALDTAVTIDHKPQRIRALLELSRVASADAEMAQAVQYANEAINLAQANDLKNLFTQGLIELGNAYRAGGDYGEAEKYLKQALEFAEKNRERRYEARALLSLGGLRITLHNADEGLNYIEQALSFFEKGDYRLDASSALNQLGRAYDLKGDYPAALQAFEKQLDLAKQVGNPSHIALAYRGIGYELFNQEQYAEALHNFDESFAIYDSLNNHLYVGYTWINRGEIFCRLGRYAEARDALNQAASIADRHDAPNKQMLARVCLIEAQMMLSERHFSQAKAKAAQALALNEITGHAAEARYTLGLAQALSDEKQQGKLSCEEAVKMAAHAGDPLMLSCATLALAEALLESGDAQGALTTALQAQDRFAQAGQEEPQWRAWLVAARASKRAGDEAKARQYAQSAEDLLSNLQRKWGEVAYNGYTNRPDVHYSRQHLSRVLAGNE